MLCFTASMTTHPGHSILYKVNSDTLLSLMHSLCTSSGWPLLSLDRMLQLINVAPDIRKVAKCWTVTLNCHRASSIGWLKSYLLIWVWVCMRKKDVYTYSLFRRLPSRHWGRSVSPPYACPVGAHEGQPVGLGRCSVLFAPAVPLPGLCSPATKGSMGCFDAPLDRTRDYTPGTPATGRRLTHWWHHPVADSITLHPKMHAKLLCHHHEQLIKFNGS